jgi:hypothetical protein
MFKEYYKAFFLFVVAPSFSWWVGGFDWLSDYLYGNTYEFSRAPTIIIVLLLLLLAVVSVRKYHAIYLLYKNTSNNSSQIELGSDLKNVLLTIYHTPDKNLQSASTLIEAGVASDMQVSKYYLEKLEFLDLIEETHHIDEFDEGQYELTCMGREYIIENQLQKA